MANRSFFESALLAGAVSCSLPGAALASECEALRRITPPPPLTQQTLNGTQRGEVLVGDDDSWDTIRGHGGGDFLNGQGGNDALFGGAGADYLDGAEGDDCLDGGRGGDELRGGAGADVYWFDLGDGEDTLFDFDTPTGTLVFSGRVTALNISIDAIDDLLIRYYAGDSVRVDGGATGSGIGWMRFAGITYQLRVGTEAQDFLQGGGGADWLHGDAGDDALLGNDGRDRLEGGAGDDVLYGLRGRDTLVGGPGDDRLWGGPGADRLLGATGSDELDGELGGDTYVFQGGFGFDTVSELGYSSQVDTLEFPFLDPRDLQLSYGEPSALIVDYGVGDRVTVDDHYSPPSGGYNRSIERIRIGGQVYSFLLGSSGDDAMEGGDGNDLLFGDESASAYQEGDDVLSGGAGDDYLWGRGGRDTLRGGSGDDTLIGGVFPDSLEGGAGDDTYLYLGDDEMEAWQPGEEIREYGPETDIDRLEIGRISLNDLRLVRVGVDLVVNFPAQMATQRVWVRDQFAGAGIERIVTGRWILPVAPLTAMLQQQGDDLVFFASGAGPVYAREINWDGAVGPWTLVPTIDPESP